MTPPLGIKILLWVLLYLLLLAGGLYFFFHLQFHFGLDSLLAGPAGERIKTVSSLLVAELEEQPRPEWNTIIREFNAAYQVKFYLFQRRLGQIAGEPVQLPEEVRNKLESPPGSPHPERPEELPPPDLGGPQTKPSLAPHVGEATRMLVHTSPPSRYWVILRTPINPRHSWPPRPIPASLVVESTTLSAGGLILDYKPWEVVFAGILLFSVLFWLPVVGGITRAISRISAATGRISEGQFDVRVPSNRRDELGLLADSVNRMGQRLQGFVTGQRRFLGDIAHELCSPLARMQMAISILEERAAENPDAGSHDYLADIREEVQEMSNLVDELLSISKASLGSAPIKLQPVNLRAVAQKAIMKEAGAATLLLDIPDSIEVLSDPGLLHRSISNLVRNAVRYAAQAGPITLSATEGEQKVWLAVDDLGPGIPDDAVARIFDPFFRPDLSRDRETGGFGLGLAIVKTCVESCGGKVSCENFHPGFRVLVELQQAPPRD